MLSTGKAIPTRRTNVSTPMPKHHNPFKSSSLEKEEEKKGEKDVEKESVSARGTIRGTPEVERKNTYEKPTAAELQDAIGTAFEEPSDTTPFEEPKIDEFGTGHGV